MTIERLYGFLFWFMLITGLTALCIPFAVEHMVYACKFLVNHNLDFMRYIYFVGSIWIYAVMPFGLIIYIALCKFRKMVREEIQKAQ